MKWCGLFETFFKTLSFCSIVEIMQLAEQLSPSSPAQTTEHNNNGEGADDDVSSVDHAAPSMFADYSKKRRLNQRQGTESVATSADELRKYLNEIEDPVRICSDQDPLHFWKNHCEVYPKLARFAKKCLINPASSAPVERVFSHGGVLMRPHRAKMTDSTLSMLLFMKCNRLDYVA